MRKALIVLVSSAALAGCADATGSSSHVRLGHWGSDQADATASATDLTVRILASGACYGSYVAVPQSIPLEAFTFPATYTQLTGAYPGKVEYAAQVTGTANSTRLSISVVVNALQQTLGPYTLTFGDPHSWPACAYP